MPFHVTIFCCSWVRSKSLRRLGKNDFHQRNVKHLHENWKGALATPRRARNSPPALTKFDRAQLCYRRRILLSCSNYWSCFIFLKVFQLYISAAFSASDFYEECVLSPQMNTHLHKLQILVYVAHYSKITPVARQQ